jgi:aldehyde:ferredoxin oxidoreductase
MMGFYKRYLLVDLSERCFEIKHINPELLAQTLGGKGLATRLLLEHNAAGADPLGPDNHLIINTGPACTSPINGSSRYGVFARSPQTGFYAESYSGGWTPEAVSRAGFDALVLWGIATSPLVLEINPGGAVFHPAQDLWGLDTHQTEDAVMQRFAAVKKGVKRSGVISIGPAGENLVRFAVLENDKWRSAGRTGMGAVLGSKKVKALVFNGNARRRWADEAGMAELVKQIKTLAKGHPGVAAYKKWGTPMTVDLMNEAGAFPSRYWSKGTVDHIERINAKGMQKDLRVKPNACLKCFLACGKMSTVPDGPHAGLSLVGPEYETIYAFGGLCEISSIRDIAMLNDLCDRLGMDTISAGNLAAFTMEASRRGRIKERMDYGDSAQVAELLRDIARGRGLGQVLGRGIRYAAREWDLEDLAIHVKGLEPPGYDPRVLKGIGLEYAISDRGACHLRATFYKPELTNMIPPAQIKGKARMLIDFEDRHTLFDTLILCRFYRDLYPWEVISRIIRVTTGLDLDQAGLQALAGDVTNSARRFNLREGLEPKHDSLPKRMHKEPLEKGQIITQGELEQLRSDYYRLRGWDESGRPRADNPPAHPATAAAGGPAASAGLNAGV